MNHSKREKAERSEYVLALVVASAKRIMYLAIRRLYSVVKDKGTEDAGLHGHCKLVLVSQRTYSAYAGGASIGSSLVGTGWAGGFLSRTTPEPETDGRRSPSIRPPSE